MLSLNNKKRMDIKEIEKIAEENQLMLVLRVPANANIGEYGYVLDMSGGYNTSFIDFDGNQYFYI